MVFNREKWEATIIENYGSMEAYKRAMAEAGAIGGRTVGAAKRRGGTEYYKKIGAMSRRGKRKNG